MNKKLGLILLGIIILLGGWYVVARLNSGGTGGTTNFDEIALSTPNSTTGSNSLSFKRVAMTSGTTTPCAITSPSATSTLLSWTFLPTVGTTTVSILTLATSTNAFATTSPLTIFANYIPMNSFSYGIGTSTTAQLNQNNLPPSTVLVAGLAAQTATGGHVMTGFCSAAFLTQ